MFHQPNNTFGEKIYNANIYYEGVSYGLHFHKSYELIYCKKGAITINIGGKIEQLTSGQCVLLFPYATHAFTVEKDCAVWVGVFSADHVKDFDKECSNKRPKTNKFILNDDEREYLEKQLFTTEIPQKYALKGYLYLITSRFLETAEFEEKAVDNADIVMKIIEYVEKNFREDISLIKIAKELGYNHQYLSKVFKAGVKLNFRSLVNQYRIDYARDLLETTSITVVEAAFESGFQSLRNFNRVYKEMMGKTPKQIKKR